MAQPSVKIAIKAVLRGNTSNLRTWIDSGGDPYARVNNGGDTLFLIAVRHNALEVVKFLIDGINIEDQNKVGHRALHEAALVSDSAMIRILLEHGAAVDALKHAGWSSLHLACTKPCIETVLALLKGGASTELRNKDGWNALHIAAEAGVLGVIQALLNANPFCWNTISRIGRTPIHTAAHCGHLDVVTELITHSKADGFDINAQDSSGHTAVHMAIMGGHSDVLCHLLAAGASASILNNRGMGPLHIAAAAGEHDTHFLTTSAHAIANLRSLLAVSCVENTDQVDCAGLSALHHAAIHGSVGMAEFLAEQGWNPQLVDKFGRTPLQYIEASSAGLQGLAKLQAKTM